MISVLPAPCTFSVLLQFGHPALQYFRKVRSGGVLTDLDYVLFSIYFAICAIWMFLESTLLWPLLDYCPLFVEFKMLFFWWLVCPEYKGAAYLWFSHIKPAYQKADAKYYDKFISALHKAALPAMPATTSAAPEVSNKEEVIRDMLDKKALLMGADPNIRRILRFLSNICCVHANDGRSALHIAVAARHQTVMCVPLESKSACSEAWERGAAASKLVEAEVLCHAGRD
ncbi:unnamed protein product [Symbiodinium necroappetens]|uniref:Receptor expression-enhancing protein n=1 Tax=Symbiodinium necroappetens TaxID=1628268 RepID=A0A812MDC8_9DINO|nr:unnamed protein product [Symbiodinium necroappetens]